MWLPKSRKARGRLIAAGAAGAVLAGAVGLSLVAMRDAVVFFYGPSDAALSAVPAGRTVRLGGLVSAGSVARGSDGRLRFDVTDGAGVAHVRFGGDTPDLFAEGRGVVVEGAFDQTHTFEARRVLAKHDETYMPREVAERLKANGHWQPGAPDGAAR